MKKIFYSLLALCSLTLSAQEKTFSFDKKVSYDIKVPEDYQLFVTPDMLNLNLYIGKDALLGNSDGEANFSGFKTTGFFTTNNRFFDVITNSLENILKIKSPNYYGEDYDSSNYQPYTDYFFSKNGTFSKLTTKNTYNGYVCNDYEYKSVEEESVRNTVLCIDEKNSVNNAKFLLPNQNVNGLIVKIADQQSNVELFISKIEDSKLKVNFDEKKAINVYNEELAKSKSAYEDAYNLASTDSAAYAIDYYDMDNRYEDPIINYSSYANSENENVNNALFTIGSFVNNLVYQDNNYDGEIDLDRNKTIKTAEASALQIVKQYKKNGLLTKKETSELNDFVKNYFKDAKDFKLEKREPQNDNHAFDDIAVDSAYAYVDISKYESLYKKMDIQTVDLAIDNPSANEYLKATPEYCKNLKSNVPEFSDKTLKNIVYNYAGQVCDLYIYDSGFVGLSSTIDALRKSVLEIYNKVEKMKKEDQEKLKTFLNSLD